VLALAIAGASLMPASAQRHEDARSPVVQRFLGHPSELHPYEAMRHLEAESLGHSGWLDATTRYSAQDGFSYTVTASGGSGFINNHVLKPILQREKQMIESGDSSQSALDEHNYTFSDGADDADGLATILLQPRRREETLIDGAIHVHPESGRIARLEGKLAKSPSFWIKRADVVRSYEMLGGANVPVRLETVADMRIFGKAQMRMTYVYASINGATIAE